MAEKFYKIVLTGDKALDRALQRIAGEQETSKHINAAMRKATRQAIKEIIKPDVMARVPEETGLLKSQVVVRALPRSRVRFGSGVTLKSGDPQGMRNALFSGEAFYGGFLEFGFKTKGGGFYAPDMWLRLPLYNNTSRVRSFVKKKLREWIRKAKQG